jgi:DsbC/DsbD-like thiol-disulfide interchange protein
MTSRDRLSLASLTIAMAFVPLVCAHADPLIAEWTEGFNNRARLVAGDVTSNGSTKVYAGLEIEMPDGWKTYWRTPGDAGGVPPEFDWKASENLAEAKVLYPAPRRLTDKSGDVVGYKNRALFPVVVTAIDPSQPVKLRAVVNYGVCKDICVPAEVTLALDLPPRADAYAPLQAAVAAVPGSARAGSDPELASWRLDDTAGKGKLILEVTSQSPDDADAFADLADGTFVPLPKRIAANGAKITFEIALSDGVDIKDLKGKPLRITLVDGRGQSETTITLE